MAENTNGITEAIIAKANEDAERILSVAEEYKQAKLEEATKVSDGIFADTREETKNACAFICERGESSSRIERKKALTRAKAEVVDGVFDAVKQKLATLDKEKTVEFFASIIEKNAEAGDKIVLSVRHADIKDDLIKTLGTKNMRFDLSLSDALDGGLVLSGKNSDKDYSFDAIVGFCKENLRAEAAKKLFGTEGNA